MELKDCPGVYRWTALLFLLGSILYLYHRIYFGVGLADESFYLSMPYSFVLGNRPFWDEINFTQNAAILMQPMVKTFLSVTGSPDGIVLYARHLFLLCLFATGTSTVLYLKKTMGVWKAILAGGMTYSFIFTSLPGLSYNTIASFAFVSGSFLMAMGSMADRSTTYFFLGTLLLAAATFSYPPLLLASSLSMMGGLWLASPKNHRPQVTEGESRGQTFPKRSAARNAVFLAALISIAFVGWIIANAGIENLRRVMIYVSALGVQGGGGNKLHWIATELVPVSWSVLLFDLLIVAIAFLSRNRWTGLVALILILVFVLHQLRFNPALLSQTSLFIVVMSIPILYAFRKDSKETFSRSDWYLYAVSLVAGATFAWASSNGLLNAALGLLGAGPVSLALLLKGGDEGKPLRKQLHLVLVICLLIVQATYSGRQGSYDAPLDRLTVQMSSGPFAGIYTTPDKKAFLEELRADILEVSQRHSSVLFFDDFPSGYLFSGLIPRTPTVWFLPSCTWLNYDRSILSSYYAGGRALPDVVFEMTTAKWRTFEPQPVPGAKRDPILDRFRSPPYVELKKRKEYRIYFRKREGAKAIEF
jgi:hypothetical protein